MHIFRVFLSLNRSNNPDSMTRQHFYMTRVYENLYISQPESELYERKYFSLVPFLHMPHQVPYPLLERNSEDNQIHSRLDIIPKNVGKSLHFGETVRYTHSFILAKLHRKSSEKISR